MAKFVLLFIGAPTKAQSDNTWTEWIEGLQQKQAYHSGSALSMLGNIVTTETTTEYVPNDATIGGYTVVEARDLSEAVEIAKLAPHTQGGGKTEVRPCRDIV